MKEWHDWISDQWKFCPESCLFAGGGCVLEQAEDESELRGLGRGEKFSQIFVIKYFASDDQWG